MSVRGARSSTAATAPYVARWWLRSSASRIWSIVNSDIGCVLVTGVRRIGTGHYAIAAEGLRHHFVALGREMMQAGAGGALVRGRPLVPGRLARALCARARPAD